MQSRYLLGLGPMACKMYIKGPAVHRLLLALEMLLADPSSDFLDEDYDELQVRRY